MDLHVHVTWPLPLANALRFSYAEIIYFSPIYAYFGSRIDVSIVARIRCNLPRFSYRFGWFYESSKYQGCRARKHSDVCKSDIFNDYSSVSLVDFFVVSSITKNVSSWHKPAPFVPLFCQNNFDSLLKI